MNVLTPDVLIMAYQQGYFPMAETDGEIYWHSPDPRAIIPLDGVKISHSLRKLLRKNPYTIRFDSSFYDVIVACSERRETWISEEVIDSYTRLHQMGFAHSVEAWEGETLVGGLYGVALGGAFFGESMFSRKDNASKLAFVALVERLNTQKFVLLDSQYLNPYIESLGGIEIPRGEYLRRLEVALRKPVTFSQYDA
jgi:leucyl/phenylalanyl-tRNA--protein transferase